MRRIVPVLLAAATLASSALAVFAQGTPPNNSFQFRLGGFFPHGGGEMWNGNEQTFTLDTSDFQDPVFGFSCVVSVNNHLEVGFNLDFYDDTVRSSYLDWVDEDGYPIFHDTTLEMMPATVDVRFLPAGRFGIRGSAGQRHVIQPVFYLGAGVGFNVWEYEETGDFLDFGQEPPAVFPSRFVESGTEFETHALAGLELPLGPTWGLLFEGRYSWSSVDPGGDFAGLGDLDLGGFSAFTGLTVRF